MAAQQQAACRAQCATAACRARPPTCLQVAVGAARRDQHDRRRGTLHEKGVLPAAHEGAVPLHEPKILVDVHARKAHHRRQLTGERLPARREFLALLGTVVVELQQPILIAVLDEVAIRLRCEPESRGKNWWALVVPTAPVAAAKGVEELLLLPLLLLPLLVLLLNLRVIAAVQVVQPALFGIRERLVCRRDLLEADLRIFILVFVWMVLFGCVAIGGLDFGCAGAARHA